MGNNDKQGDIIKKLLHQLLRGTVPREDDARLRRHVHDVYSADGTGLMLRPGLYRRFHASGRVQVRM